MTIFPFFQGGYLPHPNVRFEGAVAEQQQATSPQKATTQTNPYARGRIPVQIPVHALLELHFLASILCIVCLHVTNTAHAPAFICSFGYAIFFSSLNHKSAFICTWH